MLGRIIWFAWVPFVVAFPLACGDDPHTNPSADGGVNADGSIPPTPAPYGLDTRPANPTCKAPARPQLDTGVKLDAAFGTVRFNQPIDMHVAPGDPTRFYIAERPGAIKSIVRGGTDVSTFYTFPAGTINAAGEGGFLSFAFHPQWPAKKEVYVSYTIGGGSTGMQSIIARVKSSDGVTLDGALETLIQFEQPFTNHDGGNIQFGPDGFLYIGFGDGGSGGDPLKYGQNKDVLFGKMLRIDINTVQAPLAYGIPASNPFVGGGGRPEIYALGLRNPWRWSFDKATGDLWCGDVGQDRFEEVDIIKRGGNYGWSTREAMHCYPSGNTCDTVGLIDPVLEYPRADGKSITGGYVYRGTRLPGLVGKFIFGDYVSGNVWSLDDDGKGTPTKTLLTTMPANTLVSFGQDAEGEVYTVNIGGSISMLAAAAPPPPSTFPEKLSLTGCFDPQNPKKVASGVIPFEPIAQLWSDGATKERYFAIPDGTTIDLAEDGDFLFPKGTVLIKNFDVGGKRVETRLFIRHDDDVWAGYSYEWNDAQTDATLLPSGKTKDVGGQIWQYPSRSQCNNCHSEAANVSLGPELQQLNKDGVYPTTNRLSNQLKTLDHIGMFTKALGKEPADLPKIPDPFGTDAVDGRARAYLHANCSNCHRPKGGGRGDMDLRFSTSFADTKSCNAKAQLDDLGLADAKIVVPGDPASSVLLIRTRSLDVKRMPQIGSAVVDAKGTQVLEDWIKSLTTCP
ncbi:MAG: hypothetical protein HOO96_31125 [Polyangiaceae bacterium]|nr:hypothetical protein [Polyangiaceae bacterium]